MKRSIVVIGLTIAAIVVLLFGIGAGFFMGVYNERSLKRPQDDNSQKEVTKPDTYELWSLVNQQRKNAGITPLALDDRLNISAQKKCEDMASKNYWSHDAPDGTEPWHFFDENFGNFTEAGENLEYGFENSQKVVDGWMKSQEHRDNMLKPSFTSVGYAVCDADNYQGTKHTTIVVQHLVRK